MPTGTMAPIRLFVRHTQQGTKTIVTHERVAHGQNVNGLDIVRAEGLPHGVVSDCSWCHEIRRTVINSAPGDTTPEPKSCENCLHRGMCSWRDNIRTALTDVPTEVRIGGSNSPIQALVAKVFEDMGAACTQYLPEGTARLYNELIMAVAQKFPGESRHETALRYINSIETRATDGGSPSQESKT